MSCLSENSESRLTNTWTSVFSCDYRLADFAKLVEIKFKLVDSELWQSRYF